MRLPGRVVALAVVFLAGCGEMEGPERTPSRQGVQFSPDQGGLSVVGTGQRIDFGRAPSGVIAALDRELGTGKDLGTAGCPAGIVTQKDWGGLVLSFSREQFVGWRRVQAQAGQTCAVTS